jgi:hypothetical protein
VKHSVRMKVGTGTLPRMASLSLYRNVGTSGIILVSKPCPTSSLHQVGVTGRQRFKDISTGGNELNFGCQFDNAASTLSHDERVNCHHFSQNFTINSGYMCRRIKRRVASLFSVYTLGNYLIPLFPCQILYHSSFLCEHILDSCHTSYKAGFCLRGSLVCRCGNRR